jgi:hypothetical protein
MLRGHKQRAWSLWPTNRKRCTAQLHKDKKLEMWYSRLTCQDGQQPEDAERQEEGPVLGRWGGHAAGGAVQLQQPLLTRDATCKTA